MDVAGWYGEMATISLHVIQGLERGQVYSNVRVPITIGREEDNAIQLNDERISRCHVKIQQDGERIILTDLQSTNGTRVNGLPVQMTVLRPGDLISLGRCVLLFGSMDEITRHCSEMHRQSLESHRLIDGGKSISGVNSGVDDPEKENINHDTMGLFDDHGHPAIAFPQGIPPLPQLNSLKSRSELADLLAYIHNQILLVLESRSQLDQPDTGQHQDSTPGVPWKAWLPLLQLEVQLSDYLRQISEPD